jgi:hypothetical protein
MEAAAPPYLNAVLSHSTTLAVATKSPHLKKSACSVATLLRSCRPPKSNGQPENATPGLLFLRRKMNFV